MYITEIDKAFDADKFFPDVDFKLWNKTILSEHEYNDMKYSHVLYTKGK